MWPLPLVLKAAAALRFPVVSKGTSTYTVLGSALERRSVVFTAPVGRARGMRVAASDAGSRESRVSPATT
eukprot:4182425-Prymnesium_polylepis.2